MSEPPRLHLEPESELERSLLDAGRSYTASSSTRAKALAALGVVGVTASSTTAASAITKAGIGKWLAATLLLAGAALPVAHYLLPRVAAPTPSSENPAAPAAIPVVAQPLGDPELVPNSAAVPVEAPSALPEPTSTGAPGVPRAESKPAAASALADELSALDAARSALASGNPSGALTGLDVYARNFPHGKLSLEAEVLRIDALAKSGQTAAAKKRAEAFIKRHPGSVLASRVRAYAGQ